MNTVDDLLRQIDDLATRITFQTDVLNRSLQRIQTSIKVLNYQLGILGVSEEPNWVVSEQRYCYRCGMWLDYDWTK